MIVRICRLIPAFRLSVDGTDYDFGYAYDPMGRLQTISHATYPAVYQYAYDVNSNVTARADLSRGTTLGFVPDELNRMKERIITLPTAAGGEVSHERYGYDAMSRLTSTAVRLGVRLRIVTESASSPQAAITP